MAEQLDALGIVAEPHRAAADSTSAARVRDGWTYNKERTD
jgi:hypothetical protein